MILLEFNNTIIVDTLTQFFNNTEEKPETIDIKFSDFDGVLYHISNLENKTNLFLSISWRAFADLQAMGATQILEAVYKEYVAPPQNGFNFSLKFDLSKVPANKDQIIQEASLLKRHLLAAPFVKAFDLSTKGETSELFQIRYRDNEAIFVQAQKDRVTVIFSTAFKGDTDIIFGKVFLQEFVDARRTPALQNAPQVLFYPRDPPVELKDVKDCQAADNIGYVTFVLFPRHYSKENREKTISLIQTFRDYLHYHIKCSKAYMHSRMRARVTSFLKVLNRAKPEIAVERKTISGKTFKRY